MKDLNIPLEEFLRPFFSPQETVCVRIFSDRKGNGFKGQKINMNMGKVQQFIPILNDYNKKNCGIFFVVNFGGNEDKDITRINAQFVENDNLSLDEQYKNLMAFPLEPSLIVKTKKSLHAYWLINDGDVKLFRPIQMKLAQHFKGDKSIVNESRVLRLPGFEHRKGDPVKVTCIKYNPELRYTQEQLLEHLPKDDIVDEQKTKLTGNHKGIDMVLNRCEFIKHCKDDAKTLSEHDWYAMITNLAVFEGGEKTIHDYSNLYPNYSEKETNDKIQHYLESNTRPINCSTLFEKGFTCKKFEEGKCSCKAPASLVYVPFNYDELLEVLVKQPVTKNVTKDVEQAALFITDYMYNTDLVTAEPFIATEIKKHFELKHENIKTLMKKYKEEVNNFQKEKKKRADNNDKVPAWYEPTDNGLRFIPGVLATHMSKEVPAFYGAEDFYIYESGVYKAVKDLVASKIVREHLIDRYATMSGINDALGQWQMLIYKPVHLLNANPFIINVQNGLYNLLDDTLKPHTPDYFSTVQIMANYNVDAKCPLFLKFLHEVLDKEEIYMVQEILGYLLIPINKAQKSFVFVGAGNAGKSTLLSVAQEVLLGSQNVSNVPWQALADRFKTAELFGKLANIFADLPSKSIDDNGLFKSITGEDYITVEKKNKSPFSFKPYARLLFSCNEIPRNYGDKSNAFYRRLIIIRFDRPIPMDKRDAALREKLAVEADGIFMWALEGLKRLIKNNYQFSESDKSKAEVERYRTESNSVLSFVDYACELQHDNVVESKELYRRYKEYCDEAGLNPVSQIRFNKELMENVPEITSNKDPVSRRVVLNGIGLT
jgi:putative DNA primase/helicase